MQGYTYFFLFLHQNIDCGYSLEPPRRGKFFSDENFHFLSPNNLCLLHRQVFVMEHRQSVHRIKYEKKCCYELHTLHLASFCLYGTVIKSG